MPKKGKEKASSSNAPATESVEYDKLKFVTSRAWNWYNNELEKKSIVLEKGLKINEGWDNNIQQIVFDRDWERFVQTPPPAVGSIVREFYANAVEAKVPKCFVRGKRVSFEAKTINAYFGSPSIPNDDWTPYWDKEVVDVDEITRTICEGDVVWDMTRAGKYKHFKIGFLNSEAKAWYSLVTSRLDPGKHVSEVTLERAKLVFAIMSGMSIDIGRLIRSKIFATASTTATGMWFPSLITVLCRQAGVVIGEDEFQFKPLPPIERVSQTHYQYRYVGREKKRERVEMEFQDFSPPHGPPGVVHQAPAPPPRRSFRVTIEDRLESIQSQQQRQEEFMKYQFDWQMQLQQHMESLSIAHGMGHDDIPVYPELRPGFFPAPPPADEPRDMETEYEGGWSPYVPAPHDTDVGPSSFWGPAASQHDEHPPSTSGTDTPIIDP